MNDKIFKVALVGCGAIAPNHLKTLTAIENVRIVALCDLKRERAEKMRDTFSPDAKIYESYEEMLNSEELYAVHIATPHYLHAPMATSALRKNINVFLEKPVAISNEELNALIEEEEKSEAKVCVCFQNRFNPSTTVAKALADADGGVLSAYGSVFWCRSISYYTESGWRGKYATEGGGVMINQAIHGLDLLQWLCGMPESVLAHLSNVSLKDEIEVEDTAFCLFKMKNGAKIVVNATNAASFSFHVRYTFRASGHTVEIIDDNILIDGNLITKRGNYPIVGKEVWGTGHFDLIKNFYHCLKRGEKFSIGFEEGKNAVLMVLAIYRSNGCEIEI